MSHVATIDLVIDDLDALAAACELVGLKFVRGQKTWKWFGKWMNDYANDDAAYHHGIRPEDYGKSDHAIVDPNGGPGAYEIGVVKKKGAKGFSLVYDFYGSSGRKLKEKVGGERCEGLAQEYAASVATKTLQKQGLKVKRVRLTTGEVQLVATETSGW